MSMSSCFHGCADVRFAVRVIAILDFWIGVLLMIRCLSALNPFYVETAYSPAEYIPYICNVFTYLFLIFVFLYLNYYLKDSTYDHKIYKIHQWLSINTIFLSFHVLAVIYIFVIYGYRMIYYSLVICFVHSSQIYVVKCFYDDQVGRSFAMAAAAFHNNATTVHCGPANPTDDRTITTVDGRQFHQVHGNVQQQSTAAAATSAGPQSYALDPMAMIYPRLDDGHPSVPGVQQQRQYTTEEYHNPPPYTPGYGVRVENNQVI